MSEWTTDDEKNLFAWAKANISRLRTTKRGIRRARQRAGLNRASVLRAALTAFERGNLIGQSRYPGIIAILHGEFVWHFGMSDDEDSAPLLVTVMPLSFYHDKEGCVIHVIDTKG